MSALPKLKWGNNRYTIESQNWLSTVKARAARGSVGLSTQRRADAIFYYGNQGQAERVRNGTLSVDDAN